MNGACRAVRIGRNEYWNRHVQKPGDAGTQNEFRNFGFTNARDHRTWFIAEYRVKTAEMLKPQVNWTLPDGSSHRLYADRAIRINGVWTFFNAAEYSQADARRTTVAVISNQCAGDAGIHRKTGGN